MAHRVSVLVFSLTLFVACTRRPASDPQAPTFRTPEAAALVAAFGGNIWPAPSSPFVINVPPDSRDLQKLLAEDLGKLITPVIVLRDSSAYAKAKVSEDQLRAWGRVYDVRFTRDSAGSEFEVRLESCRGFGCHSGFRALVRSERSRYYAKLLGYWEE